MARFCVTAAGLRASMVRMKRAYVGWMLLACGVVGALLYGVFALANWLHEDEAPLDYSSMDIRRGAEDAEVNGYTALRELAQSREIELGDFFQELDEMPREDWDVGAMAAVVEEHAWAFAEMNAVFAKPEFYFDQPITPDTLIPEVGFFRDYVRLGTLQARVAWRGGEDGAALERLLELEQQLSRYREGGGGLISMLTAVACHGILEEAISDFLAEASLSPEAFGQAASEMDFYQGVPRSFQSAMRHEFHFTKYCIEMMVDDPHGMLTGIATLSGDESEEKRSTWKKQFYRSTIGFVFKPTQTLNTVYRGYAEVVEEAPKPASAREYEIWSEIEAGMEKRGRWQLVSRNAVGVILLKILLPAVESVQGHVDRSVAAGAATQLGFALRAYYGKHGELPESLEALVPDYLEAIPRDPFDGEAMRYSRERAIVYSVGEDFIDDGGSSLPFRHELRVDDYEDPAERDLAEPTFPLRFVR